MVTGTERSGKQAESLKFLHVIRVQVAGWVLRKAQGLESRKDPLTSMKVGRLSLKPKLGYFADFVAPRVKTVQIEKGVLFFFLADCLV